MVLIRISKFSLELNGHAESDVFNHDLVCAGVSAVVLGAVHYWKKEKLVEIIQNNNGYLKICFSVHAFQIKPNLQVEFNLVIYQLKLIAKNYKQNLKIENH